MGLDPDDLSIIVDHREIPSGIVELLTADELFSVEVKALSCGDYLLSDLVIERKTADDLLNSLKDGRLFPQLFTMKRLYRRRALIIEGNLPTSQIGLEGLIVKITTGMQVPIIWSKSTSHTAVLIRRAALQLFKLTASSPVVRRAASNERLTFQQRYVLLGLPLIGVWRANALLKKFGSLQRIFNASLEELADTPGIGVRQARRIRDLLETPVPSPEAETNGAGTPLID